MKWYALTNEYIDYLKEFDSHVPNNDYGDRMKCFLGDVCAREGEIVFVAPLTSYKPKFENWENDIDFYKVENRESGKIFGAINLNNMIPVPKTVVTEITEDNLPEFRVFANKREQRNYWKLLQQELACINEEKIHKFAEKLLIVIESNPMSKLAGRCCKFQLLEHKAKEFGVAHMQTATHQIEHSAEEEFCF